MSEEYSIKRVPASVSGTPDGVELQAMCSVATFAKDSDGNPVDIAELKVTGCKMLASIAQGTLSISVRDKDKGPYMVTVRTDEVMALVSAGLDYHKDVFPHMEE